MLPQALQNICFALVHFEWLSHHLSTNRDWVGHITDKAPLSESCRLADAQIGFLWVFFIPSPADSVEKLETQRKQNFSQKSLHSKVRFKYCE